MLYYICDECGDTMTTTPSSVEGELILKCATCQEALQSMTEEMDYYKELYEQSRSSKYDRQY